MKESWASSKVEFVNKFSPLRGIGIFQKLSIKTFTVNKCTLFIAF